MNTRDSLLSVPTLVVLLCALALAAAPHAIRQPFWLTTLVISCGVWRYLIAQRAEQLPPAWLRTLLTVAVAVGIFGSFGSLFGRDAGTALLTGMTALKLLEMRRRRDVHVLIYLGYFLIATQFLYDQSIPMIFYLGACSWVLTVLLMAAHQAQPPLSPWRYSRQAASLLLQALPLMLVLFVLFPRLPGPLWRLPDDAQSAISGLSDTMSPGDITHLSQSDEVAFRVDFEGPPPPAELRYWRGPVLSSYDGRTWRQGTLPVRPAAISQQGEPVRYNVLLEPHNRRWLFSLDVPLELPPQARWGGDLLIEAMQNIHSRRSYALASSAHYRLEPQLTEALLAPYLTLPEGMHPKARALARQWRQQAQTDADIVAAASRHFKDKPFAYTLRPPSLNQDTIDEFLFKTQQGFCEHYASAFTVLMRAAGIPARVVTGYLGGEFNPLGDYLIVRQSDAHAWTEIWLQGQGWIRVDATAFIAPERVEQGLAGALSGNDNLPFLARRSEGLLKTMNLQWDALNTAWNRWVLGYDPELQQQLMDRIGLGDWRRLVAALGTAMALTLALLAAMLLIDARRQEDPLLATYARFCRKLERRGLGRELHEGPHDYAARISRLRPEIAADVTRITQLYSHLRYESATPSAVEIRQLRRQVRNFSP